MNPNSASLDPASALRPRRGLARRTAQLAGTCFLALGLGGAAGAQGSRPADPAAPSDPIAAAKALQEARLKADFDRYAFELRTAVAGFQAELSGLQQQGVPREKWPPHPNVVHYTRFEELAMQDQPDALRWCLAAIGQIGLPAPEAAEKKLEIYARLVVVHADLPWMSDVARWIQSDGSSAGIGFERADDLLRALAEGTTVKATRASALAARSALLSARLDPASQAEYQRLVRELAEKHADTPAGAAAKGRLFQFEFLAPGKTPPDVQAVDTDGKPLRLADYRGKVLVLEFWGFW
ncbi:MAG: hypothetical protein NTY35_15240 [Planctomycetota bacterium]|nr:hypothetical protein [Planctomycetota bacterium]